MTAKTRNIETWALTGLAGALLLFSDAMKLTNNHESVQQFLDWGYSDSFRIFIGVIEVAGVVAMLIPPFATLGACGLAVVMLGAAFTHLAHGQAPIALVPLTLLGIVLYVAQQRRSEIGTLFGADRGPAHGSPAHH